MSKKKRKNKKVKKALRPIQPQTNQALPEAAVLDVRPDLRKTAILTTVCLGILLILYLTQSRWSNIF